MDPLPALEVDAFTTMTLGIVVYFLGARLTAKLPILRAYSIPEPVSGGLLAAVAALGVVWLTGREVTWTLSIRDALLVYFFTTVGLNARLSDLVKGGPVLALMLALTLGYMFLQNLVGLATAVIAGLPVQAGVLLGTASLVGGHGTAIAWGPTIARDFGVEGAAELGVAMATLGLILASVLGGPIAKHLVERRGAAPEAEDARVPGASGAPSYAAAYLEERLPSQGPVNGSDLMRAILWIHVAIMVGFPLGEGLKAAGLSLPAFVPCLIAAIFLSNLMPRVLPRLESPAGAPAVKLTQEFSLSVFLSMSLMSMELWTLGGHVTALAINMVLQSLAAVVFILLVVFPLMGRNYFAAVISGGFAGFTLGATPTAIANMTAVTQRYGPAPLAFIVLPLVSAFFVDIANALIMQFFLSL
ncbi:MAG: sodium/glutamate symporter [Pseudomonadota bacterium]